MIVFDNINDVNLNNKTAVALGTFDGIHIGHREIIRSAVQIAREKGLVSVCYTFSSIPLNYIRSLKPDDENAVHLICSEADKLHLLEEIGIDVLVNVPFDSEIMDMKAENFVNNNLAGKLQADTVCCGFNYTYGAYAKGNVDTMKLHGERIGLNVNAHEAVKYDGQVVSSTLIREKIREGNMMLCEAYLGRRYSLTGIVEHGQKIGSDIGFPTLNCKMPKTMEAPPNGVYFTETLIDGTRYKSISNIGIRPTVGGNDKTIETHIFGFDSVVYSHEFKVELLKFDRAERKFSSLDTLKEQIALDCSKAKAFHNI